MKRCLTALVAFAAVLVFGMSTATAGMPIKQAGNFGIGLGAGTTAAPISLKYFLSSDTSLQGNVGWWKGGLYCRGYRDNWCRGWVRDDALGISGDFLFEGGPLAGNENLTLDWEIGGGAGVGLSDVAIGVAVAFVAGLQLNIHALPIDVVLEYRLPVYFIPDFGIDWVDFTGHIRYYF